MSNWKQDTGSLDLEEILKEFGAGEPEVEPEVLAEESDVEVPAVEEPVAEVPAAEEPVVETPTAEVPEAEAPAGESASEESVEEASVDTPEEAVTGDTLRLVDLRQITIPAEPETEIARDSETVRLDTQTIVEAAETRGRRNCFRGKGRGNRSPRPHCLQSQGKAAGAEAQAGGRTRAPLL